MEIDKKIEEYKREHGGQVDMDDPEYMKLMKEKYLLGCQDSAPGIIHPA